MKSRRGRRQGVHTCGRTRNAERSLIRHRRIDLPKGERNSRSASVLPGLGNEETNGYQINRSFKLRRVSGKIQSFGPVPGAGAAASSHK